MIDLTKPWNRTYIKKIVNIKTKMHWRIFKLWIIRQLLHACYLIDNDTCERLLNMKWSEKNHAA